MKIYNKLIRIFDNSIRGFRKKKNMQDIKQVLCLVVYVKLSQGIEKVLEKFRSFNPFEELDLVEGRLIFFYSSDELNALVESSVLDAEKEFDCAYSMGMLTLEFNHEGKLQSLPMGLVINDAILKTSRLCNSRSLI